MGHYYSRETRCTTIVPCRYTYTAHCARCTLPLRKFLPDNSSARRRGEAKQSKSRIQRAHCCSLTDSLPLILRRSIARIGKIRPRRQEKEAQARIAERASSQR